MEASTVAPNDGVISPEQEQEQEPPPVRVTTPLPPPAAKPQSPKAQPDPPQRQQSEGREGSSASLLTASASSQQERLGSIEDGQATPLQQAQQALGEGGEGGEGVGPPPGLGTLESIEVMVRVRPLLEHEALRGTRSVVECGPPSDGSGSSSGSSSTDSSPGSSIDSEVEGAAAAITAYRYVSIRAHAKLTLRCKYDHVFGPEATQPHIYQRVKAGVKRVLEGYNSTIMAYGQTGSGKTHSMFGSPGYAAARPGRATPQLPDGAGIIPRAIADIISTVRRREAARLPPVAIYCSFVQIYNEQLFDMLRDGSRGNPLVIHEDSKREIYVEGLSEFRVRNMDECLALLRIGEENRAIRETHMNQASSRSHSIFQLVLEQELPPDDERMAILREQHGDPLPAGCILRSKLNLVDLAGSEKWDTRQDIASQHARELANINSSLFTLGRCISALCAKGGAPAHVPFRESKLTRLIQDSLGGNTKTYLLATLSPTPGCVDESISTLKFADRAKQVMMYVRPNERPAVDRALVDRLQREVARLRAMVLKLREAQVLAGRDAEEKGGGERLLLEERVRDLERHLGRERTESERLRQALKEAQAARDGLMRGLRLQAETAERAQQQQQQSGEAAARSAELAAATQKLQEAEEANRRVAGLLGRFFAFEIQEAELRQAVAGLVPNVDALVSKTPPPQTSPRITTGGGSGHHQQHTHALAMPPTSPMALRAREADMGWTTTSSNSSSALVRQSAIPPRRVPAQQLSPISCGHRCSANHALPEEAPAADHHHLNSSAADGACAPSPWAADPHAMVMDPWRAPRERHVEASLKKEARDARHGSSLSPRGAGSAPPPQPRWRSPGASSYPFDGHVRGQGVTPSPLSPPPPPGLPGYAREDEEQRLAEQLQRARQRMQRHIKLQEWLIRKEQLELEAMEREEAGRRVAEQARREADVRFREHARRQKKKLEAYYAGLRQQTEGATGSVGVGRGLLGPSPPPILDLRPRGK